MNSIFLSTTNYSKNLQNQDRQKRSFWLCSIYFRL